MMAPEQTLRVLQDTHVTPTDPLTHVENTFARWLYLPDLRPLHAVVGTVAANLLPGDPTWLLLVGPPGSGKSELLQSISGLEGVYPTATLTEPALLSGTAKRDRAADASGGLLRTIGDLGIIMCKDFGSVLSMHRDARGQVLAALREIYDGSWTRHVGTDGGKTLSWSGKVGLLAGCTPVIDRHHAVMGAMGERFVLFRISEEGAEQQARRALAHAGKETRMRAELAAAIAALFSAGLREPRELTGDDQDKLVDLSTLVVRCRSAVERDSHSRDIELIPGAEAPTRLIVVLSRMLAGLDAIGLDTGKAWHVVVKAALDSIPQVRRDAMHLLYTEGEMRTPAIGDALDYPTTTARRALEDLKAYGIVRRHEQGRNKGDLYGLSDWARQRYSRFVPVLSGGAFTSCQTLEDFSGTTDVEGRPTDSYTSDDVRAARFDAAYPPRGPA